MGFVENATQKVTNVALAAKDRGGELVDKVKLNANLAKEQKALKDTFAEIGRKYAESHPEEMEGEMGMLLKRADDCQSRIDEIEEKLKETW